MPKSEFLKVGLLAVKKAEKLIMKYYGKTSADLKEDKSPVTLAEIEAEKILIETIKKTFPEHGFI
ncbi:Uncharacterised protein [Candidatus Tiddalikarchaeum anstoanum]|nr:Uncharacterised protein [Candidatus Tiddalikarchaeum anstoanum]